MTDIERSVPEFRGGNERFINHQGLADLLVDTLDAVLYNYVREGNSSPSIDNSYEENSLYWHDAMEAQHYEGMRIRLAGFHLSEWIPSAPGRYYTPDAEDSRYRARRYVTTYNNLTYLPIGKEYLLLGGVGCVRLAAKSIDNTTFYFLGASSTGVAHQGIAIAIREEDYRKVIGLIKTHGGCLANMVGSLRILPRSMAMVQYVEAIPKYCLTVNEVQVIRPSSERELLATVAISFPSAYRSSRDSALEVGGKRIEFKKSWSFCSFWPSRGQEGVADAVHWLSDYAKRYSHNPNPQILSDFDEHYEHFNAPVEFGLKDVTRGRVDIDILQAYAQYLGGGITLNIEKIGKVNIMGDVFKNIGAGATIINRSNLVNAMNVSKDTVGSDVSEALSQLAEFIEQSGNNEAAENFNAFTEELQQSSPRKSLLRSFWNGMLGALPTIADLATVAGTIAALVA